jgi:fimbrial isopeptide formation D2 family protein/LPXTG-motif cell wall-anchored protein
MKSMKIVKRLFSTLMALALVLTLSVSAFAATGHTITINSKTGGHTYQAYQVFAGTYDSNSNKLSDITWGSGVDSTAFLTALQSDATIGSKFTSCTSAADVANAISGATAEETDAFAAVAANHLTGTAAGTSVLTSGSTFTYTISGLADGYYFVKEDTTTGAASFTKYMLQVVGDMTVDAKTDSPSVTKKVLENNDGTYKNTWNDAADYSIGDSVPFRLTGLVPNMSNYKTYTYQFNDTLSGGLTFNSDSVKVYFVTGTSMAAVNSATDKTGWTELTSGFTTKEETNGFTLSFSDLKTVSGVAAGGYIVVEYNATLNANAVAGNPGNPNEVTLTYSNNPNNSGAGTPDTGTTPKDEVVVFTFTLPVNKVIKGTDTSLSGAVFALFTDKTAADAAASASQNPDLSKALKFDGSDGEYHYNAAKGTVTSLTDKNGAYSIQGLDQGTYYLVEISAPAGYNKLAAAQTITVTPAYQAETYHDGHIADNTNDQLTDVKISLNGGTAAAAAKVENAAGSTLPVTGGVGTKIFTYGGIVMMLAAAVVFIAKRKTSGEEQ